MMCWARCPLAGPGYPCTLPRKRRLRAEPPGAGASCSCCARLSWEGVLQVGFDLPCPKSGINPPVSSVWRWCGALCSLRWARPCQGPQEFPAAAQTRQLKAQSSSLMVGRTKTQKQGQQGRAPPEALENPSLLFWFLVAPGVPGMWPHKPSPCLCLHEASSSH